MITTGRSRNRENAIDRLLIMKIITGLGLVVLLIVGAWSGGHRDAEDTPHLTAGSTASMEASLADGSQPLPWESAGTISAEQGVAIGLAGCLLGVICGFIVLAVARTMWARAAVQIRVRAPRLRTQSVMTGSQFAPPPSLTQLSLSRT